MPDGLAVGHRAKAGRRGRAWAAGWAGSKARACWAPRVLGRPSHGEEGRLGLPLEDLGTGRETTLALRGRGEQPLSPPRDSSPAQSSESPRLRCRVTSKWRLLLLWLAGEPAHCAGRDGDRRKHPQWGLCGAPGPTVSFNRRIYGFLAVLQGGALPPRDPSSLDRNLP